MESKIYKGYKMFIYQDEHDPREDDNLGTMVCFHGKYKLGDTHDINHNDFSSFEEMERYLVKKTKAKIILPLYLYDHSGITMSTTAFSCRWDSGQVGFIYITAEKIRKEYNVKRISPKLIEKVTEILQAEVKEYDDFLTGNQYQINITDEETETHCIDSFNGNGYNEMIEDAEKIIDRLLENLKK